MESCVSGVSRLISRCLLNVSHFISLPLLVACAQEDNLFEAPDHIRFSSVWSIANQINFNRLKGGLFRNDQAQFNWNFQPVMPVPFNGCYNIVNRMVIPFYNTPYVDVNSDLHYIAGL